MKKLLIGGRWVEGRGGEPLASVDPTTGREFAWLARAAEADVDAAVLAARRAASGPWRRFKPFERQAILLRLADLIDAEYDSLARLEALDFGGPITRATLGRTRNVGLLRYYAGAATTIQGDTIETSVPGDFHAYTVKEPIGVVGGIIPWNAPITMAIWKIAPAIAAGCTVVLKPSEEAALAPLRLGELAIEAGLPEGVLNIVTGAGDVGALIAAHPGIDKVCFTGSTATGQAIIRASAGNVKRVTLELGGKSPNIVFPDADLDLAVAAAARAAFANSGQICSAGTRLYVHSAIAGEFSDLLVAAAERIVVGDSLDPATEMGPLASARQLEKVSRYMDVGRSEGARLLTGGRRLTDDERGPGFFVTPTIFAGVSNDMRIAREEIFGPVLSFMTFDDDNEIIEKANDTDFGLGSGVWTSSVKTAHRMAKEMRAGLVWVNCYQVTDPALPFGGFRMSGYGKEAGIDHVGNFLQSKTVVIQH